VTTATTLRVIRLKSMTAFLMGDEIGNVRSRMSTMRMPATPSVPPEHGITSVRGAGYATPLAQGTFMCSRSSTDRVGPEIRKECGQRKRAGHALRQVRSGPSRRRLHLGLGGGGGGDRVSHGQFRPEVGKVLNTFSRSGLSISLPARGKIMMCRRVVCTIRARMPS